MTSITCEKIVLLRGGQFEPTKGGQFEPTLGGQFKTTWGGHFQTTLGGQFGRHLQDSPNGEKDEASSLLGDLEADIVAEA